VRVLVPHRNVEPDEWRLRQVIGLLPPPELIVLLFFATAVGLLLVR
jgi:hypothetical protein